MPTGYAALLKPMEYADVNEISKAYNFGRIVMALQNLTDYAKYFVRYVQECDKRGIKIIQRGICRLEVPKLSVGWS